jgi:hypothetical protein
MSLLLPGNMMPNLSADKVLAMKDVMKNSAALKAVNTAIT